MADPTVLDLALYFYDSANKNVVPCWVPQTVYSKHQVTMNPAWRDTVVAQHSVAANQFAYVINLSLLIGPGQSPGQAPAAPAVAAAAAPAAPAPAPASKTGPRTFRSSTAA